MCADPIRHSVHPGGPTASSGPLVCYSHLRWSFVWQRPQHLLSRFAADRPLYFVEEPEFFHDAVRPRLDVNRDGDVTILTPVLPAELGMPLGFNARTNPVISDLLTVFFEQRGLLAPNANVTAWYYTPMALGLEPRGLRPACVVYDVMDELANFRGAPADLREREQALFDLADVVFTGGPSLYQSRLGRHHALHCFPSGVDVRHFAQAREALPIPEDVSGLTGNVVGFYGVIDERMDLALIDAVAELRPEWNLVMIGPVAKIAPSDLPRRANIRYIGKRDYRELPAYLAQFDAAILPFARNEATQFISPTKTLEYLAAGKPVVSTSIKDVVDLYGSVVEFGDDPATFVAAIERLWDEPATERRMRRLRARRLLAEHGWDVIAQNMRRLVHEVYARRAVATRVPELVAWSPAALGTLPAAASD